MKWFQLANCTEDYFETHEKFLYLKKKLLQKKAKLETEQKKITPTNCRSIVDLVYLQIYLFTHKLLRF